MDVGGKRRSLVRTVSSHSDAGTSSSGNLKTNQDSSLVMTGLGGHIHAVAAFVIDGHGEKGHVISAAVKTYLAVRLCDLFHTEACVGVLCAHNGVFHDASARDEVVYPFAACIRDAVREVDRLVCDNYPTDTVLSGCALAGVIVIGLHVITVVVGDCRACVISESAPACDVAFVEIDTYGSPGCITPDAVYGAGHVSRRYKIRASTTDCKPSLEKERLRIVACGGVVTVASRSDGRSGPWRVRPPPGSEYHRVGIAMSRSIGDTFVKPYGVTADPIVSYVPLHSTDRAIVVMSDGVTDVTPGWVIEMLCTSDQVDDARRAERLVEAAGDCWDDTNACMPGNACYVDDITAIVLTLRRDTA